MSIDRLSTWCWVLGLGLGFRGPEFMKDTDGNIHTHTHTHTHTQRERTRTRECVWVRKREREDPAAEEALVVVALGAAVEDQVVCPVFIREEALHFLDSIEDIRLRPAPNLQRASAHLV